MNTIQYDRFLLALRNDLVQFWGQLVLKHSHEVMMDKYTSFAEYCDLLDPEAPCHIKEVAAAIATFRMAVVDITPIDIINERRLEAFHGSHN